MARHKLLVVDTSYSWEAIRERGLEHSVTCRDLDGFFEHVWTVHPFASLVETRSAKHGRPEVHSPAPAHTFINGKIGRFEALRTAPTLNFVCSQIGVIAELIALARREKISAVRAGDPLYNGLIGLAVARACGIPLVVRVGANYDKIYERTGQIMRPRLLRSRRVEKALLRTVLAQADLVAAANEDNLRFALANGATRERSTIFRYGNLIDRRHLVPPAERGRDPSVLREVWTEPLPRFLLYVGRLEKLKSCDDAIRALAALRRANHDVKLLMVGDGAFRGALVELARDLDVGGHVVFCGNRDQDWLSRVIPLAAAVVSPLTGRALAECAFGAAPIAAYDLDWQGELIATGVTGELVPPDDWVALSVAVGRFLDDPEYARKMGDAARRRALEMLDPAALDRHERASYAELFRALEP